MKKNAIVYGLLLAIIAIYVIQKILQLLLGSLYFSPTDRINVLFYGPESAFYSIDKAGGRNYMMYFQPDLKMDVPGGYGSYKVGSLGKLVSLDKKPEIYRKTLAFATASFVHIYFYPKDQTVYTGNVAELISKKPSLQNIFFQNSNANIFDRIYLFFEFSKHRNDDFHIMGFTELEDKAHKDVLFEDKGFVKNSIGLLYQKVFRGEKKNTQILYSRKYKVAQKMSNLLEGNGIRVNDLSLDLKRRNKCVVIESGTEKERSITATFLAKYFKCELIEGNTDVYDIIFVLGTELEVDWEV